jgi:hypothetical protein
MPVINRILYYCELHKPTFGKQKVKRYCRRIKCCHLKNQPLTQLTNLRHTSAT